MSNAPQFPDPLGVREVYRPGATAHKAGPDIVRRVQNLEQGAAGRPGPGVSNGSVLTSDTTQTGGVKWRAPGIMVWNTVERGTGVYGASTPAGTYMLAGDQAIVATGTNMYSRPDLAFIRVNAADYAVTGLTTKVRILCTILNNGNAPGVTITGGLHPISSVTGAAASNVTVNLGAASVSAAVASAAGMTYAAGTSTSLPADGYYILAVAVSGTAAANSSGLIDVQLQMRHE